MKSYTAPKQGGSWGQGCKPGLPPSGPAWASKMDQAVKRGSREPDLLSNDSLGSMTALRPCELYQGCFSCP